MAYVKQGPWTQGSPFSADQATAMDEGIAAAQLQSAVDLGLVSGAVTLDAAVAQTFVMSLSANATLTFTNMSVAGHFSHVVLFITANGKTVTWPTGLAFSGGAPPSLTGTPSEVVIEATESSVLMGRIVGTYS